MGILMLKEMIGLMYTVIRVKLGKRKIRNSRLLLLIEELYLPELYPGMASSFELASIGFYDE